MIFLVRSTLKQNERLKMVLQASGTAKRVIWLSICTYLVFACFVSHFCSFLLRDFYNSFYMRSAMPHGRLGIMPSHYDQTMIYDAYTNIRSSKSHTICIRFLLFASHRSSCRTIHLYIFTRNQWVINTFIRTWKSAVWAMDVRLPKLTFSRFQFFFSPPVSDAQR